MINAEVDVVYTDLERSLRINDYLLYLATPAAIWAISALAGTASLQALKGSSENVRFFGTVISTLATTAFAFYLARRGGLALRFRACEGYATKFLNYVAKADQESYSPGFSVSPTNKSSTRILAERVFNASLGRPPRRNYPVFDGASGNLKES